MLIIIAVAAEALIIGFTCMVAAFAGYPLHNNPLSMGDYLMAGGGFSIALAIFLGGNYALIQEIRQAQAKGEPESAP